MSSTLQLSPVTTTPLLRREPSCWSRRTDGLRWINPSSSGWFATDRQRGFDDGGLAVSVPHSTAPVERARFGVTRPAEIMTGGPN